ncbi:MAG: helix-turn-helix transcriptional regulator [Chloroflexota bacterium]|nr:helix-turn-helix transcriptional regulator [Chloroflexota bacterium]
MLGSRPPTVAAPAAGAAPSPAAPPPEAERPDALATDVARVVRELRTSAGLSERAAARLLGTSQTQLRRMEDPRYLPSLRSLARVAAAYGHRIRISFEPKEKPPARPPQRAPARPKPAPTRARRGGSGRGKVGRARRRT